MTAALIVAIIVLALISFIQWMHILDNKCAIKHRNERIRDERERYQKLRTKAKRDFTFGEKVFITNDPFFKDVEGRVMSLYSNLINVQFDIGSEHTYRDVDELDLIKASDK